MSDGRIPALIVAAAAGLAVVYWADPAASPWYPPCLLRLYTGFACPGCGSARALHAALHGRLLEALSLNPWIFAVGPLAACWLAVDVWRRKSTPWRR